MKVLVDLDRKDQDEEILSHVKHLIWVMFSTAEVSPEQYIESNRAIQQVGMFLFYQPRILLKLKINDIDSATVGDNDLCGLAANIACRQIAFNNDLAAWMTNDYHQACSEFEHCFVNLLAEYVSRIKGGEYIGDLREAEGNRYPVSKELV
jgi:hypothetical protein